MPKQKKTNAARILDEKKIEYTLIDTRWMKNILMPFTLPKKLGCRRNRFLNPCCARDKTGPVFAVIPETANLI